jgi:hypothetical protein
MHGGLPPSPPVRLYVMVLRETLLSSNSVVSLGTLGLFHIVLIIVIIIIRIFVWFQGDGNILRDSQARTRLSL